MYVHFVRHGETLHNRKGIHQDGTVALGERGKAQIARTASRLTSFAITKLITSDLRRAEESARIIGNEIGLVPEPNPLFREVRRPSELFDIKHISLKTLTVGLAMLFHLHDQEWHYSDEENLYDLRTRIVSAVEYLKTLQGTHEHVVVVSHSFFGTLLLKYMCKGKKVRIRDYVETLFFSKKLANGSISTLQLGDTTNPGTCDFVYMTVHDTTQPKA